jgi:hypothetical protein
MNDASEHEWEMQESACLAERSGLDSATADGRVGRYRLVARALRTPLVVALPADFATQVSARIAASRGKSVSAGVHLESVLLIILAGMLVAVAGRVFANLGHSWIEATRAGLSSLGATSTGWLLAFFVCIGLSWIMEPGRYRRPVHAQR